MSAATARRAFAKQVARVVRGYVRDVLTRPTPTTLDEVPPFAHSLNPRWLTAALCGGTAVRVTEARHETVSNGTTCRSRLYLRYDGPEEEVKRLPDVVFVKSTSTFATRLHVGANGGASGEVRFYRDIGPTTDILAPEGYYGAAERRTGRSVLLIEDLGQTPGIMFGDCRTPWTRSQAEGLVRSLATVHGCLLDSPRFEGGDLRPVLTTAGVQQVLNDFMDWERRTVVGVDRAGDALPAGVRKHRDRLHPLFMGALALDEQHPRGLVHSDVHAGNWYATAGDRMGLLDWSAYSRGRGTRDVGYALMSGLATEDRRVWERDLLALYADAFAEVTGIPQDGEEIWLSYRQQLLHGLTFWLTTIGRSAVQPRMQSEEVALTNLRRMGQAVEDLDTVGALTGRS